MKYSIRENVEGIDISVEDLKNKKAKMLEAFQECQEGRCSCPTEEYRKLESLEVEHDDGNIRLHLTPKAGITIDTAEIARCLQYTSGRVEEESDS
jgi:hypothetical protein